MKVLLLSLSVWWVSVGAASERPEYIGCASSDECGKGACCVIGMGRYSMPRCESYRDLAESCRPGGSSVNVSLEYPDRYKIYLTGVYHFFCPCLDGLSCGHDNIGDDVPRCMDGFLENHLDEGYEVASRDSNKYQIALK